MQFREMISQRQDAEVTCSDLRKQERKHAKHACLGVPHFNSVNASYGRPKNGRDCRVLGRLDHGYWTIQIKDEKHSEIWKVNSCSCINLVTTALDAEVNDVMEGIQEEMLAAMSAPLHTIPHQDC